ncbi:hypothetical protein DITRI_Ditri03aG0122900 [Diplodiscus trichospermus]
MQGSPVLSLSSSSPSFNNCSSAGRLAEIASRVVEEFRQEYSGGSQRDIYDEIWPQQQVMQDDDFEFPFVCREPETSVLISADEIFYNGQIRPIYPLFNTKLLYDHVDATSFASKPRPRRLPLGKLMSEERETASSSSSEADDQDGVTPGTYCVWTPKGGTSGSDIDDQESHGKCKKSNSTGSSKRWKLRDLLYRRNSDGKDTFDFLAPSKREKTCSVDVHKGIEIPEKFKEAEEQRCGNNGDVKPGEKRTLLPSRQDLVEIFSNVNGFSRNLHPF